MAEPESVYLIVDPLGDYAERMVMRLAERGRQGIAVFSSPLRQKIFEHRYAARFSDQLIASYGPDEEPVDIGILAEQIGEAWRGRLSGIIPWDEMSVSFGAKLGQLLGLGWNSPSVIERCRDKGVMKSWLREATDLRINAGRTVRDAEEAIAFQADVGSWPIVVKPSGGAGSTNVFFARSRGDLLRACQEVFESRTGEVLLEEFIGGDEFAVNGIVDASGGFLLTDCWYYDKRESRGRPNLYYQSIKVGSDEEPFFELADYAAAVVRGLGLRRSPVHLEIKVDDRGPCLIEVGARFAGGNQPMLASKLHGLDLFSLAAGQYVDRVDLGPDDVDYARYDSLQARIVSGIQDVEIPQIRVVHGKEEVESLPSFLGFGTFRGPGTKMPVTRDLDTKAYEVYLMHPSPEQIEHDAAATRHWLTFE
ncbi:MAG: ATP-grasp domain-containing protein [Thermoanaerobaculia bacterium]|nr:ATP-grasp domain-containing protein [Thermoanaerobaculia bacterium]